ncbi:hypothetical protein Cgig2_014504 [Carnegiea gigantea]|uniref:Uncharacterized protein n=1 Tax=Carnegiea gigantea TaxID=171969 RepID=A0A9Q1JYI8_9CARY|nr:hypothetical protein Cgig2_014504 [Carnegiea gigantea]
MSEFASAAFRGIVGGKPSPRHPSQKTFDPCVRTSIWPRMNRRPNTAEKLYVLHGPRLWSSEVALTELRWGAFESWIWLFDDGVYEARVHPKSGSGIGARADRRGESSKLSVIVCAVSMAFPPIRSTREMANYVRETFIWRWRSALHPPRPLPEDFNVLCPCFSLAEAEATAAELELPEIVQATFYAMLLNEMLELSIVHEYTAERMKSSLVGLRWSTFEVWIRLSSVLFTSTQLRE